MVWEDKTAEREVDTVYTNNNDVPLYLRFNTSASSTDSFVQVLINGYVTGATGNGARADQVNYNVVSHIIPAGQTYEVRATGTPVVNKWCEARMPVAVGTGGKTVTCKSILDSSQPLSNKTWTNVIFNKTVTIDSTDTSLINTSTGRFEPKEDGYYYMSSNLHFYVDSSTDKTVGGSVDFKVYRDGSTIKTYNGSNGERTLASNSARVNGYAMGYLKVGDSVQVRAYGQTSAGSLSLNPEASNFSVFLISGGSASGDSATLESLGIPNHDKVTVKENGDIQLEKETANNVGYDLKTVGLKADKTNGVFNNWSSAFYNSAGETPTFGQMRIKVEDVTKGSETGSIGFYHLNNGTLNQAMSIGSDGYVTAWKGLSVKEATDISSPANLHITESGILRKSTVVSYSAEEVDKKLAIKDKLIEKLSARLDELEKRMK